MTQPGDSSETATYEVGFAKPPRHTQFRQGVSGNPKGRPKGSKSVSSILAEMGRQRVTVTINGRVRKVSKLEMVLMQLSNKAASGDLKAIRELLDAHRIFIEPEPSVETAESLNERDTATLINTLNRIRNSEVISTPALAEACGDAKEVK